MQLTIDGVEVPHGLATASGRRAGLTETQLDILRWIRLHGWISSTRAGGIVHAHAADEWFASRPSQGHPSLRALYRERRRPYAASDGLAALRRLSIRGYVVRVEPGAWWLREDAPDVPTEKRRPGWRDEAVRTGRWRP